MSIFFHILLVLTLTSSNAETIIRCTDRNTPSPTTHPTYSPSNGPTSKPSISPFPSPTNHPTNAPTTYPTPSPTLNPTPYPTTYPTSKPTETPTRSPTNRPTPSPTPKPTEYPTTEPTIHPTERPTAKPTEYPTPTPTGWPTRSPTRYPTRVPTKYPTKSPTKWPTPTPTKWPSVSPTAFPTEWPTPSPLDIPACPHMPETDTVILNDISCPISSTQCTYQQNQISFTLAAIKGAETDNDAEAATSRVSYIEFDTNNVITMIPFDVEYNTNPVTISDINSLQNTIRESVDCDHAPNREVSSLSTPKLLEALQAAKQQFTCAKSDDLNRNKKIVIFSNCKVDNIQEICGNFQHELTDIDIIMINNGQHFVEDDDYIMCLVENDEDRIFNIIDPEDEDTFTSTTLPELQSEICLYPTPTPTFDPTADPLEHQWPTASPNAWYASPSPTSGGWSKGKSSHRRLGGHQWPTKSPNTWHTSPAPTAAVNGGNAPCMTLAVGMETENLLPLNDDWDSRTNLIIIGRAVANVTDGRFMTPASIQREVDEEHDYPEHMIWRLHEECYELDIKPQTNESYWPKEEQQYSLAVNVTDRGDNGFVIRVPVWMNDSVVYVFVVENLPLQISHDCDEEVTMNGAIYQNDALINRTENLVIAGGDTSLKVFNFDENVVLTANRSYEIRFELVGGYPTGCSIDSFEMNGVSLSSQLRRRLQDEEIINYEDFIATATPDSCTLGAALAQSDAMQTGIAAMCGDDTAGTLIDIEEGLFQQHASQSAIANHLFKTGSLHIFTEDGTEEIITDWPEFGVQEPCIAIDEENLVIYAIGGHDGNGNAVDYIQAYQFDTREIITDTLLGNKLDKPRYGAQCFYWDNKLVVISGMAETQSEFTLRSDFYQDVQMLDLTEAGTEDGTFFSWNREITDNPLAYNVIDGKPLLYDDHILYFFGGKTHVESKEFVVRMDLNQIASSGGDQIDSGISLIAGKALPLIDQVLVEYQGEIQSCFMVFLGQSYANNAIVEDGIELDNINLFCNGEIVEFNDARRRLQGDIPKFTAFDIEMMEKGNVRRRLLNDSYDEATEVFVRQYEYGTDNIWYNYTALVEICYDNNDALREAEEFYMNIIDSIGSDDNDAWIEYKEDMDERIFNYSLQSYEGWSNGFGAVDIFKVDVLEINYKVSSVPTQYITKEPTRVSTTMWQKDDTTAMPTPTTMWSKGGKHDNKDEY